MTTAVATRPAKPAQRHDITEIGPEDVQRIIDAAACERDRLLIQAAWVTGGRISEVLEITRQSVQRDYLILPNRKNPAKRIKRAFLPNESRLPGELLLWADEQGLGPNDPLFVSRKGPVITRGQAWRIIKAASERAGVLVMAIRPPSVGAMVPIWPHVLRHSRARQILRHVPTGNALFLVQEQLGHARPQVTYLRPSDDERRLAMRGVPA